MSIQREVRAETSALEKVQIPHGVSSMGDHRGETAKSLHACKAVPRCSTCVLQSGEPQEGSGNRTPRYMTILEILQTESGLLRQKTPEMGSFCVHNPFKKSNDIRTDSWYSVHIIKKRYLNSF